LFRSGGLLKRAFETARLFTIPQKPEVVFSAEPCRPEVVFDNQRRDVLSMGGNNERPDTAFLGVYPVASVLPGEVKAGGE